MRKRFISILLALAMIIASCPATFADVEQSTYQHFSSIVSLGDSNSMGYGLKGYKDYSNARYLNGGVIGSFPQITSKILGVEKKNTTNISYPAFRSKDMLYFLGGDVDMTGDVFFENSYNNRLYHAAVDSWRKSNGKLSKFVPSAKTMGKGLGADVGNYFINKIKKGDENQLVIIYAGAADVLFAPLEQLAAFLDTDDIPGSISKIVKAIKENINSFKTNVPKLIAKVKELNPDCTIALVGTFNPVKNLSLSSDKYLPIFNAMSSATDSINNCYKCWAKKTENCVYVDISNVETATLEKRITIKGLVAAMTGSEESSFDAQDIYHATPDGYKYIARQITDKFKINTTDQGRDIIVDVGSLENVTSVRLDGKKAKFTFDSSSKKLTVSNCKGFAQKLTVHGEKNGETFTLTYCIKGNSCKGYTAKQIYAAIA